MSLDNFIVGEGNEVVFRFLNSLNTPDGINLGSFNPIYLWGASGCGKTHLLMAMAQSLRQKGLTTLYARAMTFTEHVVNAIRSSEMRVF